MERIPVSSSNVAALAYDPHTDTLEIEFKGRKGSAGSVYSYANVPLAVWHAFLRSPTKGGFFAAEIKGKYSATKIQ